jgi:hypothetical protein
LAVIKNIRTNMNHQNHTKAKASVKGYAKPTPAKWRKIGDGLLLLSTTIAALNLQHPSVAIAVQVSGVIGKFLTNFFHDSDTDAPTN